MTTAWKRRAFLLDGVDLNPGLKTAVGLAFTGTGAYANAADQKETFDTGIRLSENGQEPATASAVDTPCVDDMIAQLKGLMTATKAQTGYGSYAIVANTAYGDYEDGELIESNMGLTPGIIFTFNDFLAEVENQFGLQVIQASGGGAIIEVMR